MEAGDFNVSVDGDRLDISGRTEKETEKSGKGYWRKEIRRGSFDRSVHLPKAVDESGIRASYGKEILTITLPKKEEKQKPHITITSSDTEKNA